MKYRILYVGYVNDNIRTSVEMFSYGIIKALKSMDVDLEIFNLSNYDPSTPNGINKLLGDIKETKSVDFVLCHMYYSDICKFIYNALKKITKYEVTVFMENPICDGIYDRYFLYFDTSYYGMIKNRYKVYNAPILKDFYPRVPKLEKSILLDHGWEKYKGTSNEISDKIINWLKDISNEYKIYKLVRYDEKLENIPDYINLIPHMEFKDYINEISKFEIFISTHCGSYNSSVVDMLAFGAKCIIPKINGVPYIPQYNIDYFNLPVFTSRVELINEIKKPLNYDILNSQINKCTDINDIIFDIDKQFRNKINKNR